MSQEKSQNQLGSNLQNSIKPKGVSSIKKFIQTFSKLDMVSGLEL